MTSIFSQNSNNDFLYLNFSKLFCCVRNQAKVTTTLVRAFYKCFSFLWNCGFGWKKLKINFFVKVFQDIASETQNHSLIIYSLENLHLQNI